MKKYAIIDTFALMFRAYYALPDMKTQEGLPSGAIFGVSNFLLQIINGIQPDYMVAVIDTAGKTFRHEQYEQYKANRTEAPDDFQIQVEHVFRVIQSFGIPIIGQPGFEADDIAGTLTKTIPQQYENTDIICVTGDQDYLQLVNEHVRILTPQVGFQKTKLYDTDAVIAKLGVRPDQVIDFKAMKGDASDNVPGVPGIGQKTAAMLLNTYEDLDGIYHHIDTVQGKIKENLIRFKDQAYLSRDLVTIDTDMQLPEIPVEISRFDENKFQNIESVLSEYDCFSIIKKLRQWKQMKNTPNHTAAKLYQTKIQPTPPKPEQQSLF